MQVTTTTLTINKPTIDLRQPCQWRHRGLQGNTTSARMVRVVAHREMMGQIAATATSDQPVRATRLAQEKSLRVLALFSLASGPRKVPNTPSSEGLLTPNQCFSLMK